MADIENQGEGAGWYVMHLPCHGVHWIPSRPIWDIEISPHAIIYCKEPAFCLCPLDVAAPHVRLIDGAYMLPEVIYEFPEPFHYWRSPSI